MEAGDPSVSQEPVDSPGVRAIHEQARSNRSLHPLGMSPRRWAIALDSLARIDIIDLVALTHSMKEYGRDQNSQCPQSAKEPGPTA